MFQRAFIVEIDQALLRAAAVGTGLYDLGWLIFPFSFGHLLGRRLCGGP